MPVSEKFEPRLATLLDHQRVRAAAKGQKPASVEEEPINVVISHAEALHAEEQRERNLRATYAPPTGGAGAARRGGFRAFGHSGSCNDHEREHSCDRGHRSPAGPRG